MSAVTGMMAVTGTVSGDDDPYTRLETWGAANGFYFYDPYCSGNAWGSPWNYHTSDSSNRKLAFMMLPNSSRASAMITAGHKVGVKEYDSGNRSSYTGTSSNGCGTSSYNNNFSYHRKRYIYYNEDDGNYYETYDTTKSWRTFTGP